MHWWQYIPALLIDYAFAAIVGFVAVALAAIIKVGANRRVAFIREYGGSMMLGVLAGIFGVPFVSLFIWFPIFFALSHIFGFSATYEHRMGSFLVVCVVVFLSNIAYAAKCMLKDFNSSGRREFA